MAKTAEKTAQLRAALDELRSPDAHVTPKRLFELLADLPPAKVNESSAAIIREFRGPLPGGAE